MAFGQLQYMAFRSLKYTVLTVVKTALDAFEWGSGSETLPFFFKFAGLGLRTGAPKKLRDLRFADWHTSEICGFAIADMIP